MNASQSVVLNGYFLTFLSWSRQLSDAFGRKEAMLREHGELQAMFGKQLWMFLLKTSIAVEGNVCHSPFKPKIARATRMPPSTL